MDMTFQEALRAFQEADEQMRDALQQLRHSAKEEGMKALQTYITEERFSQANQTIEQLNEFTKIDFHSNAEDIAEYVRSIFEPEGSKAGYARTAPLKKKLVPSVKSPYASVALITEDALSSEELELIKVLGYTSVSRVKDTTKELDEALIGRLADQGYIEAEEILLGERTCLTFELSAKGRAEFEKAAGMEAAESFKQQLMDKYGSSSKGFFLYDVETGLQARDYLINDMSATQIEIAKDSRHFYLTIDTGEFEEAEYLKILNRKNQMKNIGFVCINERTLTQAKAITRQWSKDNESKCKFLSVHFTTLERIEQQPSVFETLKF